MGVVGRILLGIIGVVVLAGVGLWFGIRHVASDIGSHMITSAQFEGVHVGETQDAVHDRLGKPGGLQPDDKPTPPAGTTCDYCLQRVAPADVVLLDVQMPGLDGVGAARELSASPAPPRT
ncbi:hypothetical protein [Streptomyces sp. NPDC091217]|uniref:hypothetical protein n=1 Tax=Streptomyces sp. NPDC091217 TaxID=3365975 RepID=UPI003829B99E